MVLWSLPLLSHIKKVLGSNPGGLSVWSLQVSTKLGFSPGTLAFMHSPKTWVWLISDSKLSMDINASMNDLLPLCLNPVTDCPGCMRVETGTSPTSDPELGKQKKIGG